MLSQQAARQIWLLDLPVSYRCLESNLSGFLKTSLFEKGGLKSACPNLSEILRQTLRSIM